VSYKKPLPVPDADSQPFWEGCRKHRLRIQKCAECGQVRWPPSIVCPECLSQNTDWIVSGGRGKVYTYVVYHQAFHPAFEEELPYVVAVVELEEGPLILSNIVGCPHDFVKCEMPVEVTWEDITEEFSLPKFQPIQG